ncbi:MAG: acetate--CoA ligase family protein [Nitrospinae bacterium]|nr:acetate--CoA ligase family protein [Nitrospinota bacterium]
MQTTTAESLARLLKPESVAVIGASANLEQFNGRVVRNLLRHGFSGRVYPVNPKYEEVAGLRCWPGLGALPETPDVAFITVGRERVADVLRQCAEAGVGVAIIYTGGFSEADEAGAHLEAEIQRIARNSGIRVCGPNTAGVHNFHHNFHLAGLIALDVEEMLPGRIGVVCQSGSIGGALLSRATQRGIGFSHLISCGNEMDLELSDYLDYLIDDAHTRAIAVYLEGARDGEKFKKVLEKALQQEKPLVVLKLGEAREGAQAALSHTGAVVGEDRVYVALFQKWGVTRVDDLDALFEVAHMFCVSAFPEGNRVGVVTTTGGAGALMADKCGALGLEIAEVDDSLGTRMKEKHPAFGRVENPLDTTIADIHLYGDFLESFLGSGCFDVMIPIVGSSAQFEPDMGVEPIVRLKETNSDVPMLAYFNPHAEDAHRLLARKGIASFQSISGCAQAAAALIRYARVLKREKNSASRPAYRAPFPSIVEKLSPSGILNEAQSLALARDFGLPVVGHRFCRSEADVRRASRNLRFPLVLKGVFSKIHHKTEWGLVKTGLGDEAALDGALVEIAGLRERFDLEGYLLQEQVEGGVEFLLGVKRDPQFGPVVTIGLGGVDVELLEDVSARVAPLSLDDAYEMMDELKCRKIFESHRGRGPLDKAAFAEIICRLGDVAFAYREQIAEMDLNPVFLSELGGECLVADALIITRDVA